MNRHFNSDLYVRPLFPGLGEAVARRTFLRENETWGDVASRVALGNALLHPSGRGDLLGLEKHIASGLLLMSGRHLQHGDVTQPGRNLEVFSNCSSAATSSMKFYLLLNGSGVGRCYDDDIMVVDWSKLPKVDLILSETHPDYKPSNLIDNSFILGKEEGSDLKIDIDGYHEYDEYHFVADSREGWGKAVELLEYLAYSRWCVGRHIALDFSNVRAKGSPIKGMQNRPSAGPVPTMQAIYNILQMAEKARNNPEEWPLWKQNLYVDHFMADCVHLGGARRAARIAVKYWRDKGILEYCRIKQDGGLWSANMSVGVDQDYYDALADKAHTEHTWAMQVANAIVDGQINDKTGEPGTVNLHRLTSEEEGLLTTIDDIGSVAYPLTSNLRSMYKVIGNKLANKKWKFITNPCGEIVLSILGGFCVIADVALGCAQTLTYIREDLSMLASEDHQGYYEPRVFWNEDLKREITDAVKHTVRALIRTNLLKSVYDGEVKRTNRIGVSLTGIHEFAWLAYGYGFKDLINEEYSKPFWNFISYLRTVVSAEAKSYSAELGVVCPHTDTTIKPSGSVSKVFGLTEGGHLLAMRYFLRWVQFQKEDPLAADYEKSGYPCLKNLKGYENVVIVGFPTAPYISTLGMEDKLVTAAEATPQEQFQWLRLLEKYWIVGLDADGNPLKDRGNQISYTLKFDPSVTDRDEFFNILWGNQNTVKCCSVMPQTDMTAYAYQPEQPISKAEFDTIVSRITSKQETITLDSLQCASGACPI